MNVWESWIGKQVSKKSGKPFKSGDKLGVPTKIIVHPITGRPAFKMQEDDTFVECSRCIIETGKPQWDDAPPWAVSRAVQLNGEWAWRSMAELDKSFLHNDLRPVQHLAGADRAVIDEVHRVLNEQFMLKRRGPMLSSAKNRIRSFQTTLMSLLKEPPAQVLGSYKGDDLDELLERAERLAHHIDVTKSMLDEKRSEQEIREQLLAFEAAPNFIDAVFEYWD